MNDQNVKQEVLQKLIQAMEALEVDSIRPKPPQIEQPAKPEHHDEEAGAAIVAIDAEPMKDEQQQQGDSAEDHQMLEKLKQVYSEIC